MGIVNEKNKEHWIQKLIQSTIEFVGMDIELKQDCTGVNMSYNFIGDYVGYDVKRVQESIREMQTPVSLESYIKALTLHELGHAVDRKSLLDSLERTIEIFKMKKRYSQYEQYTDHKLLAMLIEEHVMNIAFEETAWENAKKMNEDYSIVDWRSFELVKSQGLATYIHLYQEDLYLYKRLVAEQSNQIA